MQALDFGDTIRFALSDSNRLQCLESAVPVDHSNLIFKALAAFNRHYSLNLCLDVHLNKNIPMQAGLGGGSGNAATTLYALRTLSGIDATDEQLSKIAGEFSSDAPFFLSSGSAICFGRGENWIDTKEPLSEQITLIWPSFGVSTPECFKQVQAPLIDTNLSSPERIFFSGKLFENDLEIPAFKLEPRLFELKQQIIQLGFNKVLMTGSGSCFYACGKPNSPIPSEWNNVMTQPLVRRGGSWYEKRNFC